MNSFGRNLRLTSFGESHGIAIGGVIDGFPAGVTIDKSIIEEAMQRRRPGFSSLTSTRKEEDKVEIISGISTGSISLGTPIAFIIKNHDCRSKDYDALKDTYRPGHADYTYEKKYGIRDYRGGGRASARETAVRVAAAAICRQIPQLSEIKIQASLGQVGEEIGSEEKIYKRIEQARLAGDSVGGIVSCKIYGLPAGVGEPVYDKLSARLAYAMLSINASVGIEFGLGFESATKQGSYVNDAFIPVSEENPKGARTATNHCGGIQGGISNGMPVEFKVAFKPTPSISLPQTTVNRFGEKEVIKIEGRHDPCVALRGVPVVEAMAWLVIADMLWPFPVNN